MKKIFTNIANKEITWQTDVIVLVVLYLICGVHAAFDYAMIRFIWTRIYIQLCSDNSVKQTVLDVLSAGYFLFCLYDILIGLYI